MTIENPPAFPTDGRIQHGTAYDGMTLRDYFAGQALAGLMAKYGNYCEPAEFCKGCYLIADAMLAVRNPLPDDIRDEHGL
jgi:hypothetical protein